jgi:hypothetical protein
MRECSYLNCIQGQDLWVLLAPFGSETRAQRIRARSGDHCGEHLQEVEVTLENKGFLELRRL